MSPRSNRKTSNWSAIDTGQRIPCFDRCQLIVALMSNINEVHSKPRLYVSVNLFWSMAAMLRDSVAAVVVVVRTRPRAILLAIITMRKSTHGFPFLSHDKYGAPLGGPLGRRSSAMNKSGTTQSKTLRNEEGYLLRGMIHISNLQKETVKSSSKRTPLFNQEDNAHL